MVFGRETGSLASRSRCVEALRAASLVSGTLASQPAAAQRAPALIEAPLCRYHQEQPCVVQLGGRQLTIPSDMLHALGFATVKAPQEYNIGIVRGTARRWRDLFLDRAVDPPALLLGMPDRAFLEVLFSDNPMTRLENLLRLVSEPQRSEVEAVIKRGQGAAGGPFLGSKESLFVVSGGKVELLRTCTPPRSGGETGSCDFSIRRDGIGITTSLAFDYRESSAEVLELCLLMIRAFSKEIGGQ